MATVAEVVLEVVAMLFTIEDCDKFRGILTYQTLHFSIKVMWDTHMCSKEHPELLMGRWIVKTKS